MTVRPLTPEEITLRTAAYLRHSKVHLLQLVQVMGLQADAKKMTKAQLVSLLLADGANIEPSAPVFDMAGLTAPRLGVHWII